MALLREIRRRVRAIAPPVAIVCLAAYFAYHAVQGERGLLAWLTLREELAHARAQQAALVETRGNLDRRVRLLRPDSLDPDLLDERAHELLNYGRDDELIVLLPNGRALSP